MQVIKSIEHYWAMIQRRPADELRTLARIKRFNERLTGDRDFRALLLENCDRSHQIANEFGFHIDPRQLSPIFKQGVFSDTTQADLNEFPLAQLWSEWINDLIKFRNLMREEGSSKEADSRFNAWRARQMERTRGVFGPATNRAMVHSILSYELSKGCSVGCWFCGVSAERFQGYFPYTAANAKLWQEVLDVAREKFGTAAQTGFCYFATEPTDNPDYLTFVEDYQRVLGVVPQTTSAAPLKDLAWTRRLMKLHNDLPAAPSRFSVLSLKTLLQIHEIFSEDELLTFELILHNRESSLQKACAGRAFTNPTKQDYKNNVRSVVRDASSIACVSGFLINMVDRTIRLVSPCKASESWPLGYRVHMEGTFGDATDFGDFIELAFDTCMPLNPPPDEVVGFREDLSYEPCEDGFEVKTASCCYTLRGTPFMRRLGDMIAEGTKTTRQVMRSVARESADILSPMCAMQDIFDKGLLRDEYRSVSDIGSG